MQILSVRDLDDCLDTTLSKEILLSIPIQQTLIYYLGKMGELDYYSDFPKPFFKIYCPGKYIIQGIEGNTTIKVVLEKNDLDKNLFDLIVFIRKFTS